MKKILLSSIAAAALAVGSVNAQLINDAINDLSTNVSSGAGTLDIVSMEVLSTSSDVTFNLTVNGNINTNTGGVDWGNFMIGIATGSGSSTTTGNGWGRPINLDSPIGGMNYWIGSWVNGGGGAQLWGYNGTGWDELTALAPAISLAPGAQSTISLSMPLANIGIAAPTLIYFDGYSSGDGGGDSAVDALSNPNVSITTWAGPYTSTGANISSATVPEPSTYALLALSAAALGGYLARRRARK